MDGLEE
jgi:hypothetical protein